MRHLITPVFFVYPLILGCFFATPLLHAQDAPAAPQPATSPQQEDLKPLPHWEKPPEPKLLGPGDAAPSLDGLTTLTGEPITSFSPGTIYVVDFWATWCGPCIQAMPHMSELAAKHKDDNVKILGLAIWETERQLQPNDTHAARIKRFVEAKKEVRYPIAYGGDDGELARRWMNAAGRTSIPTVFVVGRDGKLAWIGHPMMGLDRVLAQLVAGTFDPAEEQRLVKERENKRQMGMRMATRMQQRVQNKDWEAAQEIMGNMVEIDPEMFAPSAVSRMRVLVQELKDAERANAHARECLTGHYKAHAFVLRELSHHINAAPDGFVRDTALALQLAQAAANAAKPNDTRSFLILAEAQDAAGDRPAARATLQAAMAAADDMGKEELKARLAQLQ